jgi:phosphate transport system substrate-binding protein
MLTTVANIRTITLLTCIGIAIMCNGCATHEEKPAETATSGTLQVVADEQLKPVVDSLIQGFMIENPKAKLTVTYEPSLQAIQDFVDRKARLILVSRSLPKEVVDSMTKHNIIPPEYEVAEDAVAVIVSAKNPLAAVAMSDLRQIWNGSTHWIDLKHSLARDGKSLNASSNIAEVFGPATSSAVWLLDSMFTIKDSTHTSGLPINRNVKIFEKTDSVISWVRRDPSVIGFIGASWLHQLVAKNDSSVRAVSIIPADSGSAGINEPVMLHLAYVYEGIYPLTSRVNGYTFDLPNTLPSGFMAYVTTAHGQAVFKNFDVLPRTQKIKLVATNPH